LCWLWFLVGCISHSIAHFFRGHIHVVQLLQIWQGSKDDCSIVWSSRSYSRIFFKPKIFQFCEILKKKKSAQFLKIILKIPIDNTSTSVTRKSNTSRRWRFTADFTKFVIIRHFFVKKGLFAIKNERHRYHVPVMLKHLHKEGPITAF
jgi:hypothetical protein